MRTNISCGWTISFQASYALLGSLRIRPPRVSILALFFLVLGGPSRTKLISGASSVRQACPLRFIFLIRRESIVFADGMVVREQLPVCKLTFQEIRLRIPLLFRGDAQDRHGLGCCYGPKFVNCLADIVGAGSLG